MSELRGTIERSTLSGGKAWILNVPGGEKYELQGGSQAMLEEGMFVKVSGPVDRTAVSVNMSGPIINLKTFQVLTYPNKDSANRNNPTPENKSRVDKNGILVNNDSEDTVY